ncbi:hypothetical protein Phou_063040 [Phytohabitans houttuyneae]|uniref:ATP-binding protein n=2 Tax=Phytohabitans houttuyneae TaxID=1076126 RepID=A0A6V8KE90_9ACTN|nr:hypothetical protein Phou_063040 [Phytohabitans houttuyneae]
MLVATPAAVQKSRLAGHDKHRIATVCENRPQALAEIAAITRLPLGVARVLVSDMAAEGLLTRRNDPEGVSREAHKAMAERVLTGLRQGSEPGASPNPQIRAAKIVIAGGNGVGKTSLIAAVSQHTPLTAEAVIAPAGIGDDAAAAAGKDTTTVALDLGRITVADDLMLYLFGTPEQAGLWVVWDDLIRGAVGAVVLVDLRRIADAFAALDYFEIRQLPFLVALNEFEGAPRYELKDVREALAIDANVPLVTCDARDRSSAVRTLASVVDHALSARGAQNPTAAKQA